MNTEQTAQQLELAAQIIRTGHPWERELSIGEWSKTDSSPVTMISGGLKIRLTLATPPDGRPCHNPDNLTAEQVGAGWRLTVSDEIATNKEYWHKTERRWYSSSFYDETVTYRLPITVPWPEPQPDPYAELKKAHAEGKVIQFRFRDSEPFRDIGPDEQFGGPSWKYPVKNYRIKPTPTFQLPTPPPGMQWHRTDGWEESDLPQGCRPLVLEECEGEGDEDWSNQGNQWMKCYEPFVPALPHHQRTRTRRPLAFTHAGKTWTWHRPGGPMPCAGLALVTTLLEDGEIGGTGIRASKYDWGARNDGEQIIGWRYVDKKKTVPQDSAFFLPSTAIRFPKGSDHWSVVATLDSHGLIVEEKLYSFQELFDLKAMANRSIPLTGKWNPDAWEPCHKEIDA